jgi:sortase A
MKANKKGKPLIIFGVVLVALSLVCTGYNYFVSYNAGKISQKIVEQLDDNGYTDVDYGINPKMEMPTVKIDDNYYIGMLEIPSLNLKLPIISSWSYDDLSIAPCRFSGSVYTNDMVIAGHNYKTHFGRLRSLDIGDEIKFTDTDGNEFLYKVSDLEILSPTSVDEMQSGDCDLTLFTCTVGAKTRLAVRCELND